MPRRRIAVGQLWQEGHDFNPARTEASDFEGRIRRISILNIDPGISIREYRSSVRFRA
jgi:hypothetical protein